MVQGSLSGAATDAIHLIEDGATYFRAELASVVRLHPAWARVARLIPPATDPVDDSAPVAARVNHGRWLADCPDCGGAEMVWVEQPRLWCVSCQNRAVGHRWRAVTLPPVEERVLIEVALSQRSRSAARNWTPDETLADLLADNAAHAGEG